MFFFIYLFIACIVLLKTIFFRDNDPTELRPLRNRICALAGIKPPILKVHWKVIMRYY